MNGDQPRRRFLQTVGIGCVAAFVGVRTTVHLRQTSAKRDPRIIGHRGCALEAPENSLSAVEHAAASADAVEIDLRRAGSGEVVGIHDETVDRVTDGSGPVSEFSLEQLQELRLLDTAEHIPTLEEIVEATPPDVALILDLKERGLVDDVRSVADSHENQVLLSSFLTPVVENASESGAETALIARESWVARRFRDSVAQHVPVYPRQAVDQLVSRADTLGCTALHPRLELCLRTDLVERAHERGLQVEPWTITSVDQADVVAETGVDGLITDICTPL